MENVDAAILGYQLMSSAPSNLPGTSDVGQATQHPIVTLTQEQSESSIIELRDASGNSRGLLVRDGGVTIFYTPERIAELQRRAANAKPGKTLREVIDSAMRRAREFHESREYPA